MVMEKTCKVTRTQWSTESLKLTVSAVKPEAPLAAASRVLRDWISQESSPLNKH